MGVLNYAERGNTITTEICCSVEYNLMPLMLIFIRHRKQQELEIVLPPDDSAEINDSGRITVVVFLKWFKKVIEFPNAKREFPVPLLFDGYASHIKNLEVNELPRKSRRYTSLFAQIQAPRRGVYQIFESIFPRRSAKIVAVKHR